MLPLHCYCCHEKKKPFSIFRRIFRWIIFYIFFPPLFLFFFPHLFSCMLSQLVERSGAKTKETPKRRVIEKVFFFSFLGKNKRQSDTYIHIKQPKWDILFSVPLELPNQRKKQKKEQKEWKGKKHSDHKQTPDFISLPSLLSVCIRIWWGTALRYVH